MKPLRTSLIAAACATVLLGAAAGCSQSGDDSSSEENGSQNEGAEEGEDDAEGFDVASMEGTWSHKIPRSDSGAGDWNIDAEGKIEQMTGPLDGSEPELWAEGEVHELEDGIIILTMRQVERSSNEYLMLEPTDDDNLWQDVDSDATFEREE